MEYVTLSNGLTMPMEGFGVFQVPDPSQCTQAVLDALHAGYRLIDTAAAYMNEAAVGKAIRQSGIDRSEIFVTTKIWVQDYGYDATTKAIDASLAKLDLDTIDLVLLHQPVGDYIGAYHALEDAYRHGKIKAIGVSNFYPARLVDLCETVKITPMVNQIELHPFFQQNEALDVMKDYKIVAEAWGPFAEGKFNIFTHPLLTKIGDKYGKTAAQVALRWNVQRGVVVLPKSVHTQRIEQNFDIWDFELTKEDMEKIKTLDMGHSEIVDHDSVKFIKMLHTMKIHD